MINSTGFPDQPPVKSGAALCDFIAGIHLYGAIMTALYEREHTGKGRVVEVSMQDATYCSLASNFGMLHARGDAAPARTGNRHGGLGVSPYNAYQTTDGYVVLNAPGDHHFRAILDVIGRPDLKDDPRFLTRTARVQNFEAGRRADRELDEAASPRTRWPRMLARRGPLRAGARALGGDGDENMHARGSLQWIDHPELGRVLPHSPLVFEGSAAADRAEPAARRQQRGDRHRLARPFQGRVRGAEGGRRGLSGGGIDGRSRSSPAAGIGRACIELFAREGARGRDEAMAEVVLSDGTALRARVAHAAAARPGR